MENKMTNLMALNFVVEHCELPTDVMEKITNIRNSYAKKAEYKPTSKRTSASEKAENIELVNTIVGFLENGGAYTVSELIKEVEPLNGLSTSKVTSLLTIAIANGTVKNEKVKGKSYYSLA